LWGGESWTNVTAFVRNVLIVLLLFGTIVEIFVCAGTVVGALFSRLRPLRAYSADLLGSLLGVIVMTVVSAFGAPPPIWLAVGALPFLYFSRRALSIMSFAAIVALSLISVGSAQYSPYYRIDLTRAEDFTGKPIQLSVNRDFHQYMQDLSSRGLNRPGLRPGERRMLGYFDQAYRLPFSLTNERESALVVGAGTGNDVAAALRSGFKRVVSVDIDPLIMKIGKELHPERPYDDPRATRVVNDARAYFEQNADKRFDVVCFGLLDSHAMFSAMSSLRLENYVYTRESIRSAWRLVKPGGVLTISFSIYTGEWLSDRLYALVRDATGTPPLVVVLPMHYARMFVVGKQVEVGPMLARVPFGQLAPTSAVGWMRVPTDDWPFLYIRPKTFPAEHLVGFFLLLVGAVLVTYVLPSTLLLNLPLWGRGVLGGLVNGLPIAFAGVIFSTLFSRSTNPALSLGSNLLGAVVGGCVEYLSMLAGLKALALVALMIYLAVFVALKHHERAPRI